MSNLIEIDENMAKRIAMRAVLPRPSIPVPYEEIAVRKARQWIVDRLVGSLVPRGVEALLSKMVIELYQRIQAQPGDTVGIQCAQTIGEEGVQSTLNTFHKAGSFAGGEVQTCTTEDVIDIPCAKFSRRPQIITAYTLGPRGSLHEVYDATRHYTTEISVHKVTLSSCTIPMEEVDPRALRWADEAGVPYVSGARTALSVSLDIGTLFAYRITTNMLRECLGRAAIVPPYASVGADSLYTVYIPLAPDVSGSDYLETVSRNRLCGVPYAIGHTFQRDEKGEWCVVLEGPPVMEILKMNHVYDARLLMTSRVSHIHEIWGVYAAKMALQVMCKHAFKASSNSADTALLSSMITFRGEPMPFTRFTMRNNSSPLTKISFEESQGGFRNAALYGEKEVFKTVSSMVMVGKLPHIGSAISSAIVDPNYFATNEESSDDDD